MSIEEMQIKGNIALKDTSFWKGLVKEKNQLEYDEFGNPDKEYSSFDMIKKMMRMKKR